MAKLCPRGKAAAKRKFKVYPSAYANMYASAVCSGKVTPGGKRKKAADGGLMSKLKKGSKAANRRKSFCARMKGMKKRLTSAKTARDPDSRINKSLRKWNC
jgi:hypothetical protein